MTGVMSHVPLPPTTDRHLHLWCTGLVITLTTAAVTTVALAVSSPSQNFYGVSSLRVARAKPPVLPKPPLLTTSSTPRPVTRATQDSASQTPDAPRTIVADSLAPQNTSHDWGLGLTVVGLATMAAAIFQRLMRTRPNEEVMQPLAMFATGSEKTVVDQNIANKGKGLPFWWQYVWALPVTQSGEPGTPLTLGDTMQVFKGNIEEIYADMPSVDGAPMAEGDLSDLTDGTMFLGLQKYQREFGPLYKLCFGPKSFIVVSDPLVAKWVLTNNVHFDKGVLAEILEDIMGKGLIPADPETWKARRRAITPAFHAAWLERMAQDFGTLSLRACEMLEKSATSGTAVNMEERFGSLALDIIGKAVFNYDFKSTVEESAVVQAAIDTLKEAEHRSMTPLPYWKIPGVPEIVPRQKAFKKNMAIINEQLNAGIERALTDRDPTDIEDLQARDYDAMENPSLLRILVDMRGEETTSQQLRDDLITMLIAGHETTASALTWAIYELAQLPDLLAQLQEEVDRVLGDRLPTMQDVKDLELCRLTIAESLRMYPEPPLLIRRSLDDVELPKGASVPFNATLKRATDIFIAVYNIQRDARYWPDPDTFNPDRFRHAYKNPEVPEWKGYDPEMWKGRLYPDENSSDYAFMPFGGGPRRCLGDAFATVEATIALAMFLRRFTFTFAAPTPRPEDVGAATGATIHTKNGLWLTLQRRNV